MPSHLLTAQQAAAWLGVSSSVITRLTNTGQLDSHSVGSRKAYTEDALQAFLDSANLTRAPGDQPSSAGGPSGLFGLSFFSGAGGLDIGMENVGIPSLLFCESNREARMTLNRNRPESALLGDVSRLSARSVLDSAGVKDGRDVTVMHGGPPCQAFSTAGARRAFDDVRGNVFLDYLSLAADIRPRYLVIENVRGLLSTPFPVEAGGDPVKGGALAVILRLLDDMGYGVSFNLYNAANFGAAQVRERVILIAKRDGTKMPYLKPTHSCDPKWGLPGWRTFDDATAHLAGTPQNHAEFPEKRLRYFRQLSEGQCWTSLPESQREAAMGKAFHLGGGKTGFYRRIWGNRPSPTLVTSPTMPATDLCHPRELRPLSVEEYRSIQGFPDDWWIAGSISEQYRQIGNAVPVQLGEAIGRAIIADMSGSADGAPDGFPFSRYKNTSHETWAVA